MSHPVTRQIQHSLSALITGSLAYQATDTPPLIVAYSGGVDSSVLLHALATLPSPYTPDNIHAVYVHHGLSANADSWQAHCQQQCQALGCHFYSERIDVVPKARQSLEANAREGRYQVLSDYALKHRAILVLGQHQDDQLETFLLQAKRGAGPKGLGSMHAVSYRGETPLLRPMLQLSRVDIEQAAASLGLAFINDESNEDTRFDRNFIRRNIAPGLKQRWPQVAATISRSAALCAEQTQLLEEVLDERLSHIVESHHSLNCSALMQYSIAWQKHLIRRWLEQGGADMPSAAQMSEMLAMPTARKDAQPLVTLGTRHTVRLHNRCLFIVDAWPEPPAEGTLIAAGQAAQLSWWGTGFEVSHEVTAIGRMPAMRIRLQFTPFSKKLKEWLKLWKVPPWERGNVPLLMKDTVPLAIILKDEVIYLADRPADFNVQVIK